MKSLTARMLAGVVLFSGSMAGMTANMDIMASFSPSMDNPENNVFTNTTPQSGYCVSQPIECRNNGLFSIDMGGITASLATSGFTANSEPRMGVYFKMPGAWRDVLVTNTETGSSSTVRFRSSDFSARYNTLTNWTLAQHQGAWNSSSFVYPPSPCSYSGFGVYPAYSYLFMWKWPTSDASCYKTAKNDLLGEPYLIDRTSIGYEINTPDPLKMESGVYTGSLMLSVGPGGDIDFGDNFQASDSQLLLNFTLSVNHELKLTTVVDDQTVSLQPCASGQVCTEGEGAANWERWMTTRITPTLTGRSNFRLSSSGGFTAYLECEQQSGSDCALRSDNNPSQTVPIQTLLTLPDNIVDGSTGSRVSKRRLPVGRELANNTFETKAFGQNKSGMIDFLVTQKDVDTMLKTRPDTFRGAVTVVFDPKIY